jgi:ABC-2 type transport system permease protein
MMNLLKGEFQKARKSLPLRILLLLIVMLAAVSSLSSLIYVSSPRAEEMEIPLAGYDAFFVSLRDMPTIVMIGIIVAGVLVCADFDNRTIQVEIAAGHGRLHILLSKLIAFGIIYFLIYLPCPLGRTILQSMFIRFGPAVSAGTLLHMLGGLLTVILIGIALNSLTILLSFLVQKSMIVIGASFLLLVLGGNALLSFGVANAQLGRALALTPLGLFGELSAMRYAPEVLLTAAAISAACIAVMTTITYLLFKKAELK